MKAIVTTRYGPPEVLQLREIAMPAPQADEILIKLFASSVNPLDGYMMRGPLFFLPPIGKRLKPKHPVLGADIAGRVEAVGKNVTRFHPGDEVFGASFTGKEVWADLPSMPAPSKIASRSSRPDCRSSKRQPCR